MEDPRPDDRGADEEQRPRTSLRRPSRAPWVVGLVVLVAAALGVRWYLRAGAPITGEPVTAPSVAPSEAPETPSGPDVAADRMRALLEAVSPHELFRKMTSQPDFIRRWAIATDNLAEGVSPRKPLQPIAPGGPFTVETRGGKTVMSAASQARYDAFGDAVASVDVVAAATAYRELHGMVERAYRALGYPGASFDRLTARALQRIAGAALPSGELALVKQGNVYAYADPRVEALGPVEKHLLRMGPRNAALVQAKARELLDVLGLGARAGQGGASR